MCVVLSSSPSASVPALILAPSLGFAHALLLVLFLLPLLVLLLYVLSHVLIWGREALPYNYVVNTYSRSSIRSSRGSSIKIGFGSSFS